jgi:hypothetical protein
MASARMSCCIDAMLRIDVVQSWWSHDTTLPPVVASTMPVASASMKSGLSGNVAKTRPPPGGPPESASAAEPPSAAASLLEAPGPASSRASSVLTDA